MTSPQAETVRRWLAALSAQDMDKMLAELSANYKHHILPGSMGHPVRSKDEFKAMLTSIGKSLPQKEVSPCPI
jgi:ketosteroid isomerase-like protein